MTQLDDRLDTGSTVMVVRYGDSKASACDIVWSGTADVDLGDGMRANTPVALAVDQDGRDIAIARDWDVLYGQTGALVDLSVHVCRGWTDLDDDEPPVHLRERIDAALRGE